MKNITLTEAIYINDDNNDDDDNDNDDNDDGDDYSCNSVNFQG